MKKTYFAAVLLLAAVTTANAYAAEPDRATGNKPSKAEKIAARETAYQSVIAALESGNFVFQTEKMASERTHTVADVDSTANYIVVKGSEGVIQTAPPKSPDDSTISCRIQQPLRILDNDVTIDKRGNATCKLEVLIGNDPQTITIEHNKRRNEAVATTRAENAYALLGRVVPADRATIETPRSDDVSELSAE